MTDQVSAMQSVDAPAHAPSERPDAAERLSTSSRLKRLLIMLAAISPLVLGFATSFPICPSAAALGLPCPGCGLTRATMAVAHGHLLEGFHHHPLVLPLAPVYIGAVFAAMYAFVMGRTLPSWPPRLTRWFGYFTLALFLSVFVVWGLRFAGYLGGPAKVVSYWEWRAAQLGH